MEVVLAVQNTETQDTPPHFTRWAQYSFPSSFAIDHLFCSELDGYGRIIRSRYLLNITGDTHMIVLNNFLEVRDGEDGPRLFGKAGFQTMSPKTDRYTKANLEAIERALDAGELTDLEGNPVKDGAVIQLFCRVNKVKDSDEIDQVTSIRTIGGSNVSVPAPAEHSEADQPF